ncbi:MAG: hypothetical protein HUN04_03895 [Desulfobacter sp.]|nr:MAG: hypothetical protein HUN04_03895 [Desulfobacter sp.]
MKEKRSFFYAWAFSLFFCLSSIFLLNWAVDPLWYCGGNKIGDHNYGFDERIAKTNLLLTKLDKVDAIIFGSSVTTVLNPNLIKGYNCFNLSFSAGQIEEFLAFAKYLKKRGLNPKKIFVEVNFSFAKPNKTSIPEFILKDQNPPGLVSSYLSFDALMFSIKTLMGLSPLSTVYDSNFVGYVPSEPYTYNPPADYIYKGAKQLDPKRVKLLKEMRELFPEAASLAYVHPISIWHVGRYYMAGILDDYLNLVASLNTIFDEVYDFSVPSDFTYDTDNTWDGAHYYPRIYDKVAERFNAERKDFGIDVSIAGYREKYYESLKLYLEKIGVTQFARGQEYAENYSYSQNR